MIQTTSIIYIADNTHVKQVKCLKVLKKKYGHIGTTIIVLIQHVLKHKKLKKGQIHRALLVRTKKKHFQINGEYVQFFENSAIMINQDSEPFGKKMRGPILLKFRKRKYIKMLSLKNEII